MKNILLLLFVCTACLCCAQTNLNAVHTWAYQLQNINPSAIAADTSFKLVIIDYSTDGTDDMKFSSTQISDIKISERRPSAIFLLVRRKITALIGKVHGVAILRPGWG